MLNVKRSFDFMRSQIFQTPYAQTVFIHFLHQQECENEREMFCVQSILSKSYPFEAQKFKLPRQCFDKLRTEC